MKSSILFICVFASSFCLSAHARWLKKEEAGSVVERFYVTYDVKKNGTYTEEYEYLLRVQAEDAKTSASIFTIDYNAITDKVEVVEAYTLNGKNKIPVDASAIEDRDKGEAKEYDAMKVRSVVFPQVQIGSRLFIRYRLVNTRPLLQDRWSENVRISPGLFVEDFKTEVRSERPLFIDLNDPQGFLSVTQKKTTHLFVKNKRLLPGWVEGEKEPFFHPAGNTQLWISTDKEWVTFFSGLNQDFFKILKEGVPYKLRPWLKEVSRQKGAEQKILSLMEKMSREFRYFGDWRRHNGGLVPRQLSEIEKSRYGDCKDLSSLLVAMLRELGMQAHVAIVRRGENAWIHEPDYKLPAVGHFNHAIVRVKEGESTFWLDPTNPVASVQPFIDIAGRPAWILDEKAPHFERLPDSRPEDFVYNNEIVYGFKSNEIVDVQVRVDQKNIGAFNLSNDLLLMPRSEVLSGTLEYVSEGYDVLSYRFIKEPKTERILKDLHFEVGFEAQRVTYNAGKGAFFVIPDGLLSGPFYETAGRDSDLRLSGAPLVAESLRRLKNARLAQEEVKPCEVDSPWLRVARKVAPEGKDVVIRQSVKVKKPYVLKSEFRSEPFRQLQEQARRCFYRSGVLIELAQGKG